jgi:hypothetical protein
MGDARTVQVLTGPYDTTADYVVDELNQRGQPCRRCHCRRVDERGRMTRDDRERRRIALTEAL